MQKSKNITIAIIILMLIYGLLANLKLVFNINTIYLYIINPLFWITLAVFLKIAIGKSYQKSRIKKEVIQYILIAVIIYILTYMISGLFITFGNNPYFTTVKGFLINLWMFGTVIISKEYIRYRLINNVYENDKKEIAILVSLIYIIIEIGLNKYINTKITLLFALKDITTLERIDFSNNKIKRIDYIVSNPVGQIKLLKLAKNNELYVPFGEERAKYKHPAPPVDFLTVKPYRLTSSGNLG